MKLLFFVSLIAFATPTLACTDFSGKYIRDSDGSPIEIFQTQCENITYVFDSGKAFYIVDGQEHLVNEFNFVGSNGEVIEITKIYQGKAFVDDTLVTTAHSEILNLETGKTETYKSSSISRLDQDKNMVIDTTLDDGTEYREIYYKDAK